jgi:periplasmic protein CpxP/Spy
MALAVTGTVAGQAPGPPIIQEGPPADGHEGLPGGRPPHGHPPPRMGQEGRWWVNPDVVQKIGLTPDQQKQIDALFQKDRLKLIDASAAVEKEEAVLEPLLEADHPDEAKVLAQIDRVAQSRAELEKANARMLLGFRSVLSVDQWKKLQAGRQSGRSPDRPPVKR